MTATSRPDSDPLPDLLAELASMDDPRMREVNQRHGDEHGVNLTKLRAVAKRLGAQPDLAVRLWESGDPDGRLLALLVCRPRQFDEADLDRMLRDARTPKERDWLLSYVVKKSADADALRERWFPDGDPQVAAAGWVLTTARVVKRPDGLDLTALLDQIEVELKDAPDALQWAMNECLAQIGITNADLRDRAIAIGTRLEVLIDYPTSPGCTSPYAPTWIAEMVRRQQEQVAPGRGR